MTQRRQIMNHGKTFWVVEKRREEWFQDLEEVVRRFHLHLYPAILPAKRVLCSPPSPGKVLLRGFKLASLLATFWILSTNFFSFSPGVSRVFFPDLSGAAPVPSAFFLLLGIFLVLGREIVREILLPGKQILAAGRLRSVPCREKREVHLYFEPVVTEDGRCSVPTGELILLRRLSG